MIDHMLEDLTQYHGWEVALCACGWDSPPCPDKATAANFWGQHILEIAAEPEASEGGR